MIDEPLLNKRGTTEKVNEYTGPSGEIVIDTERGIICVQDGLSPGGKRTPAGVAFKPVSTNQTLKPGDFIYADTTSNELVLTLPANPKNDDKISIFDYKGSFDSHKLTVMRNNKLIMGLYEDMINLTKNSIMRFIYKDGDWRLM